MQDVRVDREKYIGGSDVPVMMGISPFKKRFDLLLEKAGLADLPEDINDYTEYGNIMEEIIRDHINEGRKDKFVEGKHINGIFRCHTDGENKTTILEIKTTSKTHQNVEEYKLYLVQLLHYMNQTGKKKGILAVYDRPADFHLEFEEERLQIFEVRLSDHKELLEEINEAIASFLSDLEKVKENPFITEEELQPTALIELSNQVLALENKLAAFKVLQDQYDAMKAELYRAMDEYHIKKWTTVNGVQITRVDGSEDSLVDKFNEKRFAAEQPEQYEMYLDKTVKKGRSGYVKITLPKC